MNWISQYHDTILTNPELELIEAVSLSGNLQTTFPRIGITVGSFGEAASSQMAIWRNLIATTLEIKPFDLWFDCDRNFLESYLPRSLHTRAYLATGNYWHVLKVGQQCGCFALVRNSKEESIAFVGLPTEEGLDALVDFYRCYP